MTSGRCTSALEMISFCRMPWLYDSVSSSFQARQLEQLQQLVDPPLHRRALLPVQRRGEAEELGAGQLVVDEGPVRDVPEPGLRLERMGVNVLARRPPRCPTSGRRMPAIIRMVVVFPAPLGPRKPKSSPRAPGG